MKVKYWILFLISYFFLPVSAGTEYRFRVYLKDKGDAGYTTDRPECYLTNAAIERRAKNGVTVTEADLPISPAYLDSLCILGVSPVVQSKWLSTVVVASPDSLVCEQINNLSIVDSVKWVWKGKHLMRDTIKQDTTIIYTSKTPQGNTYGYAHEQIQLLNGIWLHNAGYTGKGMKVAVIDAGFNNVNRLDVFRALNLKGTFNAVVPGETVFNGDDHGTKVLSCMAANLPGIMVGTAPEADYWLIKSEDTHSESLIEEDYWAAAVEYADSVGVDVITTSLGYFYFDQEKMNYDVSALDGRTAFISRAAQLAAEKGILVFCSAGNEGNSSWQKITFPSDAADILTVGSVNMEGAKSTFSSTGFTADYRVKPDVVALGTSCTVVDHTGAIRYANGTSFSTPTVAGLGVCLWQAFPGLTNMQIIDIMRSASSRFTRPDAETGYGKPDMEKAYQLGTQITPEI